jgi:flagellar basal-body rod protein FlgC
MSLPSVFHIASQGMTAQRERLEAAAANLANANTTRTPEGGPYRRRDVVFETALIEARRDEIGFDYGPEFTPPDEIESVRTTVRAAETARGFERKIYQPGHPDADQAGYVTMPDVDPLEETVNLISAARAFEANATVMTTAKEMARASLRLNEA